MARRGGILALAIGLALLVGPSRAEPETDGFEAWIEGEWADPRVHRCGQVHVRIRVDGPLLQFDTITYGNALPGAFGEILRLEDDGSAILLNDLTGREQRVRYVTPDAHVLESLDGSGGVTFVRCEDPGGPAS